MYVLHTYILYVCKSRVFLTEGCSDYTDLDTAKTFFLKFNRCLSAEAVLAGWGAGVTNVLEVEHPSLGSQRSHPCSYSLFPNKLFV